MNFFGRNERGREGGGGCKGVGGGGGVWGNEVQGRVDQLGEGVPS